VNPEQTKYEALWGKFPAYRHISNGELVADYFLEVAKPTAVQTIADFGCGTGRGGLRIRQLTGANLRLFDFAENCLDADVKEALTEGFSFARHDLTQPFGEKFDIGYCSDVLEHIPPEDVEKVLLNLGMACKRLFLCISTEEDHMGVLIGEKLHLTVRDAVWWHTLVEELGFRIEASRDVKTAVILYVSAYANGEDFCDIAGLNEDIERVKENIRKNLDLGLQEVAPYQAQSTEICLLAGGPSLKEHESDVLQAAAAGVPIVTVNGTYKWCLDRGIKPAAMFMVDAREWNEKFLPEIVPGCKYIFSSQAAHEAVKKVPKEQAWLYHSNDNETLKEVFDAWCKEHRVNKEWYPVPGGSTVVSRALVALAMLGFRNIEVFGWDSCLKDDEHHAYSQPENDGQVVVDIDLGGRQFKCHPWMVIQAQEAPKLVRYILGTIPDFNLCVRGDGLIAHMLNHAASRAGKED
jgi:SAM-dependent methyltransferase